MYYYKYCNPGDRQFGMLSRGELFFASADELNDGSECRPRYILKGSAELWNRLCELILFDAWVSQSNNASVAPDESRELVALSEPLGKALRRQAGRKDLDFGRLWPLIREELPPLLRHVKTAVSCSALMELIHGVVQRRVNRLLHENRYMACFSRDPRDPTMWGHYGGAERGFCLVVHAPDHKLGLSSPIRVFLGSRPSIESGITEIGHYKDAEVELQPVIYKSAPPRVNAFHRLIPHFHYSEQEDHYDVPLLLPGEAPVRQEDQFGLVKAPTWKYEKEVRAFLPSYDDLASEARCVRLNSCQFQGLIFGPKMSPSDKKRAIVACYLLRACHSDCGNADRPFVFLEACQRVESFQMNLSPTGVLGRFYAQRLLPFEPLSHADGGTAAAVRRILEEMETLFP